MILRNGSAILREWCSLSSSAIFLFRDLTFMGFILGLTSWVIWREFVIVHDMSRRLTSCKRFGGGFELMRDGDVNGLWKMMVDRIE